MLVDLGDGNRPVEILDGREAGDFADWLRAHPGVKIICRDRAGSYADGARQGAPDARQIADRWHLWDNLCQHVNTLVAAHHTCLVEPAPVPPPAVGGAHSGNPPGRAALDLQLTTRSARTQWRWFEIHALQVQGLSMPMIGRRLGLDVKTVRRYLCDSAEPLIAGDVRTSKLDPFKASLHQRLAAGVRNATALHPEIVQQAYTGSHPTLERYLKPWRRHEAAALAEAVRNRPPPVRQVTAWITGLPGHLDTADEGRMQAIRGPLPRDRRRRRTCRRLRPHDQGPVRRPKQAHRIDRPSITTCRLYDRSPSACDVTSRLSPPV